MPVPQPSRRRLRSAAAHATSACCRHDVNVTAVSHAMPAVVMKRCCSKLALCSHRAGAVCIAPRAARAMQGPLLSLQPRSRSRFLKTLFHSSGSGVTRCEYLGFYTLEFKTLRWVFSRHIGDLKTVSLTLRKSRWRAEIVAKDSLAAHTAGHRRATVSR